MYQKFEVKVKYQQMGNDGKERIVSENYLVEGVTFGDVEQTVHKELEPYISGEFGVDSIRRAKYSEVHFTDGEKFFKTKLTFISLDEERGVEKRTSTLMLVQAMDINNANEVVAERMGDSVADYEITSVIETNLVDVFILPEPTNDKEAK